MASALGCVCHWAALFGVSINREGAAIGVHQTSGRDSVRLSSCFELSPAQFLTETFVLFRSKGRKGTN